MAERKVKANKFTTDIDLCNNQIKNAAFEYWDHEVLPEENLFEGRMLFLLKEIVVPRLGGEDYVYAKGSIIVCVSDAETGEYNWEGLLFSKGDDYDHDIMDLWKNKSGNLFYAKTIAEAREWIAVYGQTAYWENDLVIIDSDEEHDYNRTIYVGTNSSIAPEETGPCTAWVYIGVVSNNNSCLGEVEHYADLEAKLEEAVNNDIIFVKEDENRAAVEESIAPSTKYRCVENGDTKFWQYQCDTGNACIRKLGTVPGTEGEPYRLPYFFRTEEFIDKIRVHSETITLDNKGTVDKDSYFLDVESATQEKAGLMSSADKKKLDTLIDDGEPKSDHVWSSEKTSNELENKTDVSTEIPNRGKSIVTNKPDDLGAKIQYEHADGSLSGFEVCGGGKGQLSAQVYAVNDIVVRHGTRLKVTTDGIFYIKGEDRLPQSGDEIATVGSFSVKDFEMRLPVDNWEREGDFFVYGLIVEEVREGTYPIVSAYFDEDTVEGIEEQEEAANHILKADPVNGGIKFYADEPPEVEVPIIVKVMG